jgi:hypothetical protein
MQKFILIFLAVMIFNQSFGLHADDTAKAGSQHAIISETDDNVMIILGKDLFRLDENDSAVTVRLGNKGIRILESLEGRKVDLEEYETESLQEEEDLDRYGDDDDRDYFMKARHFRGHLAGLEAGFNNFVHAGSMVLPAQIDYMSLETNNSCSFNLNFSQVNIGLSRYAGIVAGIGLNWNNYRFKNPNSIEVNEEGIINSIIPASAVPVKRSKFSTLYLNIPVQFEIQVPAGYSNSLNIAAGVIGGIKLNAWTKVVFEDGEKSRANGDYNLNLLRGGVTGRVGYRNFMIYGTYYLTPWFQENKGPEGLSIEPFEIGLAFTFND